MTADPAVLSAASEPTPWDLLAVRAPLLAGTMRRYIAQQTVTLAPSTILAMNQTLVRFGLWVIGHDPTVRGARDIGRSHVEAFKLKCITDVHFATGQPLATNTIRQRLRLMKVFFDRIIDWEFDDAPRRNPIIHGDVPPRRAGQEVQNVGRYRSAGPGGIGRAERCRDSSSDRWRSCSSWRSWVGLANLGSVNSARLGRQAIRGIGYGRGGPMPSGRHLRTGP